MCTRFFLYLLLVFITSCSEKKPVGINYNNERSSLIEADKAFSRLCGTKGMKNAFIEYIDSNGVLLRPDHLPIVGANAIDFLIRQNDTNYSLTWQPSRAVVSTAADMGYTYGIYSLQPHSADTVLYGTYVSIWRKQLDGKWKFVLDAGNEGIGDQ